MTDRPAESGLRADREHDSSDRTEQGLAEDSGAVPDVPETGDARVDAVLGGLSALDELEIDDHPAHYAAAHDALRGALASPQGEKDLDG